ncbi:hypothetical protein [Pseudanabaena sp. UWO310]|uniref:hypothetical protein n=1 Tax=Pseudanabaena sp. UWO310 TaxID=2480795 RepID=UPI00167FEA87|nr:hypothetical protein [Pseudanabaena sp. UWO310]
MRSNVLKSNQYLAESAVEEMLIQHLLTEQIFRSVFNNPDFAQRNIIAVEIEKVINALTSKHFSRAHFLSSFHGEECGGDDEY